MSNNAPVLCTVCEAPLTTTAWAQVTVCSACVESDEVLHYRPARWPDRTVSGLRQVEESPTRRDADRVRKFWARKFPRHNQIIEPWRQP